MDRCVDFRRRSRSAGRLGMVLGAAVLCGACGEPSVKAAPRPTVVRTKLLAPESSSTALRYSATIEERESVDLSFQVGGTVKRVLRVFTPHGERDIQEGDVVKRGDVLAELDTRDYERDVELARARLDRARSELPRAEANVERWQRELKRLVSLEGSGAVTVKQVDETRSQADIADADLDTARKQVATAEVELRQAQDRLADCTLVASVDGATVALKDIAVGAHVAANTRAFRVMDVRTVRAVFGVPDQMLAGTTGGLQIALDQQLDVFVQAYEGERFDGRITNIAPKADEETRTFLTEVTLDNSSGRLRPGMIATIRVGRERRATLLPLTAVQRGDAPGETAVFVVEGEGGRRIARRRRIELGGVCDNQVEVLAEGSEARPGDTVVVTNAWRLDDGREVAVLGTTDARLVR